MLTSAPGEHWRPAESQSQQRAAAAAAAFGVCRARVQGGGTAGSQLWAGFVQVRAPSTAQSQPCCPKVLGKGDSPWGVPVSPGQTSCSSAVTLFCAALGVARLCHLPALSLVTAGTKQELFCRRGQQVLRDNNSQTRPVLLLVSQLTLINFATVSDKKGLFGSSRVFTDIFCLC